MDTFAVRKKTIMAVFNWLLFISLFCTCIFYVTPKPPVEVCYTIGRERKCFSNIVPFDNNDTLPEDPLVISTVFILYTRKHRSHFAKVGNNSPEFIPVNITIYDNKLPTVFITHGWQGHGFEDWIIKAKTRILANTPTNVITIDWKIGASRPYFQALANTRVIGTATAHVMYVLNVTFGVSFRNMHMVGWDLGAHVAGYAGEVIKNTGNILGRITGLNPTNQGFSGDGLKRVRLDKSDALFVDVIHTDGHANDSEKGELEAIGHADFYPNYGVRQPGCKNKRSCDHDRAPAYFVESILSACSFESSPCPLSNILSRTGCSAICKSGCAQMGFYARNSTFSPSGTFYLETNKASPFCRV